MVGERRLGVHSCEAYNGMVGERRLGVHSCEAYNGMVGEMRPGVHSCITLILRPTTGWLAKCALVCVAVTL
jgi:hypothetical protein